MKHDFINQEIYKNLAAQLKESALNLSIFLLFFFIPLIVLMFYYQSWDDEKKKEKFIEGKIESVYKGFRFESPIVRKIVNKEKLSALEFADKLENNDLIFIYQDKGVVIYADDETGKIIGISNIK